MLLASRFCFQNTPKYVHIFVLFCQKIYKNNNNRLIYYQSQLFDIYYLHYTYTFDIYNNFIVFYTYVLLTYIYSGNLEISLFSSLIKLNCRYLPIFKLHFKRLKKHRKNGLILQTGLFEENGVVSRYLPIYLYDNVSKKKRLLLVHKLPTHLKKAKIWKGLFPLKSFPLPQRIIKSSETFTIFKMEQFFFFEWGIHRRNFFPVFFCPVSNRQEVRGNS